MPIQVKPDGPIPARVMIVGEAPGSEEERLGIPFVGTSGNELNRMLGEAGINRSQCFVTNVARERPPGNDVNAFFAKAKKDRSLQHREVRGKWVTHQIYNGIELLRKEIQLVKPNIIIALGNTALWALTGRWGITKWRGSMLYAELAPDSDGNYVMTPTGSGDANILARPKIVPTYHPAAVLRQWEWRAITINDLKRAKRFSNGDPYPDPKWNFILRPTYSQCTHTLEQLYIRCHHAEPLRISFDLETRNGHIACAGIAWSRTDAICIPFMAAGQPSGYWTEEQEAEIIWKIYELLTHPNVRVIGQNLLYDCQYTWRHCKFIPRVDQDTMIGQHSIFSDLPKGLAFLASMYCDYYVYWKDEGKDWNPGQGEEQLWYYNCEDCVYTYEVSQVIERVAVEMHLKDVFDAQQRMFWPVLQAMIQGVRIDQKRQKELVIEVHGEIERRREFLKYCLGHDLNPDSPKQMHSLFYHDLKLPVQMTRAKKGVAARPTLDDDALQKLSRIEPLLKPIINSIADIRTLSKFLTNFLERPLDADGRMRCSYNIGGSESGKSAPKTYRLSSSESAFGTGTNLQTIPSEKSKSQIKAAARGTVAMLGDPYQLPNIREIFIPDQGYTWFDLDLERADLHVFVWEIDDAIYKEILKRGVDTHLFHGYMLAGKEPPALDELIETHPNYKDRRASMKLMREFAKTFTHAVDYVGSSRTIASNLSATTHEIDKVRNRYLGMHPKIEPYWKEMEQQVRKRHFVENKFGYRWHIFGRIDNILPEVIAWVPQSTVSIVINRIWEKVYENLPDIDILMQVHDSIPGQIPTHLVSELLPRLRSESMITVPYSDPLVIPVSIKTSERSWGDT